MHDYVTPLLVEARSNPLVHGVLITGIILQTRKHLQERPAKTIRFAMYCGDAAGPIEWASVRVEFLRSDWVNILSALSADHVGTWGELAPVYDGGLFDVSADVDNQEVVVTFW